jgi:ribosomal protein L3
MLDVGPYSLTQLKEMKEEYVPGQQLSVDDMFKAGDLVDIAGKTIGKGFQGELLAERHGGTSGCDCRRLTNWDVHA